MVLKMRLTRVILIWSYINSRLGVTDRPDQVKSHRSVIKNTARWNKWMPLRKSQFRMHFGSNLFYLIKFHSSLFLGIQLTGNQHCYRQWLSVQQATNNYLNRWWPNSLTHTYVTMAKWFKVTNVLNLDLKDRLVRNNKSISAVGGYYAK